MSIKHITLVEFLNIDSTDSDNLDSIFNFVYDFLSELKKGAYPENRIAILDTVVNKFLACAAEILDQPVIYEGLKKDVEELKEIVLKPKFYQSPFSVIISSIRIDNRKEKYIDTRFNHLYGELISLYEKLIQFRPSLDFAGFYRPNISNKERIIFLLEKSIALIEADEFITKTAKQKFVKSLTEIKEQILSDKTNWTKVLGKVKELIILFGAIAGVTTAVINVLNYTEKDSKSEQAKELLGEIEKEMEAAVVFDDDYFRETFTFSNRVRLNEPSKLEFHRLPKPEVPNVEITEIEDAIIEEE